MIERLEESSDEGKVVRFIPWTMKGTMTSVSGTANMYPAVEAEQGRPPSLLECKVLGANIVQVPKQNISSKETVS